MLKAARDKYESNKKTGAKPTKLSDIDEIVLDAIGRDSITLTGLGKRDPKPIFKIEESKSFITESGDSSMSSVSGISCNLQSQCGIDEGISASCKNTSSATAYL